MRKQRHPDFRQHLSTMYVYHKHPDIFYVLHGRIFSPVFTIFMHVCDPVRFSLINTFHA